MFSLFTFLLMMLLVLNPLSHYAVNVLEFANTYYLSYIIWTLFFLIASFMLKYSINGKHVVLNYILFVILIISAINGNSLFQSVSDIHLVFFLCMAFEVSMCQQYKVSINNKQLHVLYVTMIIIGVLSSVYALREQAVMYILSLQGIDMSKNGWGIVSFYNQRNIFAQYCVFCSIATCYMYIDTKRKIYILLLLLFFTNIFVTNSRASLIFFLVAVGPTLFVYKMSKKYFIVALVVLVVFTLFVSLDFTFVMELFNHDTSSGEDSSELRMQMWKDCFFLLFNDSLLLIGFGKGATSTFLSPMHGVGSSHNFYIDSLFEGGLIYMAIFIYSIYFGYKEIRHNKETKYRILHTYAIMGYAIYCMMEAGSGLFAANFFFYYYDSTFYYYPAILQ